MPNITEILNRLELVAACYDDDEPVTVNKDDLLAAISAARGNVVDSEGGETD